MQPVNDAKLRCIFFRDGLQPESGRETLKMNDDTPSVQSELQGLRLIRAFGRIRDQSRRNEVIEHAERLAAELSLRPDSCFPGIQREVAAEQPADPGG